MLPVLLPLLLLPLRSLAANYLQQSCINKDCSALRLTFDNPPINLFDSKIIPEFRSFLQSLQNQTKTKVVVFSSNNPDFFADHLDLNLLSSNPPTGINVTDVSNQYFESLDLLTSTPVIFIAEINGRAFGAGDEIVLRTDMRFAGPNAVLGAPEAAGGLLHVGGLQQLVRLIGPALALEYLVSPAEVNATEAARVGWVNRAFGTKEELREYVDRLATTIALFHFEVIKAHKEAVVEMAPSRKALEDDMERFGYLASRPYFQGDLESILTASGNQSKAFELDVNNNIVKALYGE